MEPQFILSFSESERAELLDLAKDNPKWLARITSAFPNGMSVFKSDLKEFKPTIPVSSFSAFHLSHIYTD